MPALGLHPAVSYDGQQLPRTPAVESRLDRTPPAPPAPALRTLADGRYVLVRKVAEGGTAAVHLGFDTWTDQWRAVKTLLPDYAKRPALRHRFEREAATMKALSHDNIIAVYDAGSEGEAVYMVMEFAEGGCVIDWVDRHGPMPSRMAAVVVKQLCEGIDAAHRQGIVHRDVKPQNLLIDREGICKVTDFGIAQVVLEETRMTMTGTVMGTIGYMAPEQHESAKHADTRADVYSIAATFYTLVKGEAATHLFMAQDEEFEGIPEALATIIRRGSQYRREARYETVAEMIDDLEAALRTLEPDPLDTPPLVPHDLPMLDDLTPPSLATIKPRQAAANDLLLSDSGSHDTHPKREMVIAREMEPVSLPTPTGVSRHSLTQGTPRPIQPYSRQGVDRWAQVRGAAMVAGIVLVVVTVMIGAVGGVSVVLVSNQAGVAESKRSEMLDRFEQEVFSRVAPTMDHVATRHAPLEGHDSMRRLVTEFEDLASSGTEEQRTTNARRIHRMLDDVILRDLEERAAANAGGDLTSAHRSLEDASKALDRSLDRFDEEQRELERLRLPAARQSWEYSARRRRSRDLPPQPRYAARLAFSAGRLPAARAGLKAAQRFGCQFAHRGRLGRVSSNARQARALVLRKKLSFQRLCRFRRQ